MAIREKVQASVLAKRWKLDVKHALYKTSGDWYHHLRRFPGALLDADGYVLFATEAEYRGSPHLQLARDLHVPGGIKRIPGYTYVDGSGRSQTGFIEGTPVDVVHSGPERNPAARAACLAHHGYSCLVCRLDFSQRYGEIGRGYIHVHHRRPLSDGERIVDPVQDLVPLCPNCHAMVHRKEPPIDVEELQKIFAGGS